MTDQEILNAIAYDYYERFKALEGLPDRERDWSMAVKVFDHFTNMPRPQDGEWRVNDQDFQKYAYLFIDRIVVKAQEEE